MSSVPHDEYLTRIGYSGPLAPTIDVLRDLHRAHMLSVPFENLDIGIGREIVCDEERFLRKIVRERRGGFCYELNGAFSALLRELGFEVTLLSARVARDSGDFGPEFDHMALLVRLERTWLADVGFGDSFVEPLEFGTDTEQRQSGRAYRLNAVGEEFCYEMQTDTGWKNQYMFSLQPRELSDFAAMCRYHQTSPDSSFTQKRICSKATPEGRVTLSNGKLIRTTRGHREEESLSAKDWTETLRDLFGVVLPA